MTIQECYTMLHGDYQDAKERLIRDQMIERFIVKFPADPSMNELRAAVSDQDYERSFHWAHTLKGTAGNLGFTQLQKAASELTEQLRGGDQPADAGLMQKLEDSYQLVIEVLDAFTKG